MGKAKDEEHDVGDKSDKMMGWQCEGGKQPPTLSTCLAPMRKSDLQMSMTQVKKIRTKYQSSLCQANSIIDSIQNHQHWKWAVADSMKAVLLKAKSSLEEAINENTFIKGPLPFPNCPRLRKLDHFRACATSVSTLEPLVKELTFENRKLLAQQKGPCNP